MNRRDLLKLLGLAPVAAPAVAALAAQAASPSIFGEAILGHAGLSPVHEARIVMKVHAPPDADLKRIVADTMSRAAKFARQTDIEAQMREHDLFFDAGRAA